MEETRILMVVKEPEARAAYEQTLCRVGVCYHIAHSFNEVLGMTINGTYSGLLIDILTLVRSSAFFIDSRCRTFPARSLRRFNRKDTYLSLLLSAGADCPGDAWIRKVPAV